MTDMNTRLTTTANGLPAVEVTFRVRYFETDAMGIVHHASYITWFEEGRSAFTRAIGYPYSRMEQEGISLAVAEVVARYHRPARYDDEVRVQAALSQLGSRGMAFAYEVRRVSDDVLLVSGSTRHISVDAQGKVTVLPQSLREMLGSRSAGPSAR
ncbi:MAG: acyl-CoA thioesterase [Anaerolineae bacterium]|jgi:acyl-CoA thioester hydrolase|nr:acyl-CoA thioesterase [Anaerolineae bacterium]